MGCGSSTSVAPPESTGRPQQNSVPSAEDNHDDNSRVRTRENTVNDDEAEVDKHLQNLEDERKEREQDKKERDEKLQKRIEQERQERDEEEKLQRKNNKNQEKIEDTDKGDNKITEDDLEDKVKDEQKDNHAEEDQKIEDNRTEEKETHEEKEIKQEKLQNEQLDDTDDTKGDYQAAANDLSVNRVELRKNPPRPHPTPLPQTNTDLYTDHEFTLGDALRQEAAGLAWKRPLEFTDSPVLFSEGTTRFDIGQGSAGTCWFLSLVASISERKDLMKQIFPEDAYPVPGSPDYRGMFHCRFWRFGHWEDVYIDDYLPVIYDTQLWGAKSATDPNELWVALLEKAFAKFHGSYLDVYGGQTVDAFLTLTGGVGERVPLDKVSPDVLFRRLNNAINSRALVTCTVPAEKDKVNGLVGAHAYSLTGVTKIRGKRGDVRLVRIRNPWGRVEWTGPWSDKSREWDDVPKNAVDRESEDDGEFWMSLEDFFVYFSQVSICSTSPDFDMDGRKDGLGYLTELYGEWKGESAAGYKNLMDNPRLLINVPKQGVQDGECVPLVVQIVQWLDDRKDDKLAIRCDLFQVMGEGISSGKQTFIYEKMGDSDNTYFTDKQHSFRYAVPPGKYIVVPSTFEAGQENDFMVRIFSPCALEDCGKVDDSALTMSCDIDESLEGFALDHYQCFFGKWERGKNAGGQISNDSHHCNPQLFFTVDKPKEAVVINMMQENSLPKLPLGVKVYQISPDAPRPMTQNYVLEHYEDAPHTTDGEQGKFVISWDLNAPYVLPKGEYSVIVFTDQCDEGKDIAMVVKSSEKLKITPFQMSGDS